jgi:hypothetical protein
MTQASPQRFTTLPLCPADAAHEARCASMLRGQAGRPLVIAAPYGDGIGKNPTHWRASY